VLDDDPAGLAVAPRRDQTLPAHLSEDEMTRLLETPSTATPLGRRDRAILELFYASGLRLSELVGINVEDVNLSSRLVRVMGKGGKERVVPFNQATERALREWL
jgi:site-specific recombinase XerD